jgi:exopolysaccharide biosynthesis polyprenyl glycosylphosphotransferase
LKVLTADEIPHADVTFAFAKSAQRWFDYELSLKRILDILVAGFTLVGTLPICLAVVIAIKLDSPGPAIFTQQRVGRHGRRFRFLKFRSMYVDAEQRLDEVRRHNETDGPVFKMRKDPRITRVGALLRRTSLDELPQVINVLKGEMSVVGPRPPVVREVELYRPADMVRLSVKPGITCLWQIRGRSTVGFDTWMEYDREYIRGMSLRLDLSILVRTVWAVLSCKGAY